jgi:hypothetical protein
MTLLFFHEKDYKRKNSCIYLYYHILRHHYYMNLNDLIFGGDPESMMSSLNEAIIDIKERHLKSLPVVTQLLGKTAGTAERPP